ncbi:MAG: amidase [Bradyrhizobiaceae bacterium]|nr:MAG: amidase [Bradyrhizobiaceae bacterium]
MTTIVQEGAAAEAVERSIRIIKEKDAAIGAWVYFDPRRARQVAEDVDARFADGPLYGVPVGIKDIFDTNDMPTAYGSSIYAGHHPGRDAALVAQLRQSGAVVMGKTATTEFASPYPARTRNPHNLGHSPGGSSSGSAAAVASGMLPLALGSQTLGSIIRPASYCGVYGFKPSHGRISRAGVLTLSDTLDTIGALGKSVAILETFYRHITGDQRIVTFSSRKPPRLAYCEAPGWEQTTQAARDAFDRAIAKFRSKGLNIQKLVLPEAFLHLVDAGFTVHDYELYRNFSADRLGHWDGLSEKFKEIMRRGAKVSTSQHEDALGIAAWCRDEFAKLMGDFDAVITLSATDEAPEGLDTTGSPAVNVAWTLLRGPCLSLPSLIGAQGLPIGLQLCSPQSTDSSLLACANWLDRG